MFVHHVSTTHVFESPASKQSYQAHVWLATEAGLPNVPTPFAIAAIDYELVILCPFLDGICLDALCARHGPMPVSAALALCTRIAETIAAASAPAGLRPPYPGHGQLEPSHVMLDQAGRLTLLEYGFWPTPYLQDPERPMRTDVSRSICPEQIMDNASSDDRYALAMLLLTLVHGEHPLRDLEFLPFLRQSARPESHQAMIRAATDRLSPQLPTPVTELVHGMLRYSPDDRLSPHHLLDRLRTLARGRTGPSWEDWARTKDLSPAPRPSTPQIERRVPLRILSRSGDDLRKPDLKAQSTMIPLD